MDRPVGSDCVQKMRTKSIEKYVFKVQGSTRFQMEEQIKAREGILTYCSVCFNHGLLAGTPNFFQFRILENLSEVEVLLPVSLRSKSRGVQLTGMRVSFLAPRLAKDWDDKLGDYTYFFGLKHDLKGLQETAGQMLDTIMDSNHFPVPIEATESEQTDENIQAILSFDTSH